MSKARSHANLFFKFEFDSHLDRFPTRAFFFPIRLYNQAEQLTSIRYILTTV